MIQKLKYLVVGLLSVLLSLSIIEIGLRLIDTPKRPVSGWNDCRKFKECNVWGFRGQEIVYSPDDYVVLLIGDSQVAAWGVPFEQIPERRLENYLKKYKKNIKVFTLGTHGYGQDMEFLVLKKYFEKNRADLVLLFFSAQTDVLDNIFPVSGLNNTIKPTFWLKNGELLGPTEGWLEPVGPLMKLALLWKSHFGQTIGESCLEKWKKDILPPPYQPLKNYQGEVDFSWQKALDEDPKGGGFKGIDYEMGMNEGMKFTPRSEMRTYGINLTRKLFSEMKKLTEANNSRFIIFKEEKPWELQNPDMEKVYLLNGKYYRTSMKQYLDNLNDIFYGFEHCRIPLNMDNYTLKPPDQHLNQQAIDKLMSELSLIISKKEYFKN